MDRTSDKGSSDKSSGRGSGGGGSKNDDGNNNGNNNGNDQGPVVISPDAHKSHDDLGLGPVGTSRTANESFHSLETIRNSHLGTSPHPERIDPDTIDG